MLDMSQNRGSKNGGVPFGFPLTGLKTTSGNAHALMTKRHLHPKSVDLMSTKV